MSLGSILKSIGGFFARLFKSIKEDADTVAIVITQNIKLLLDSGLLKILTDAIPGGLDDAIVAFLQKAIPKALAIELSLKGIPDNATAAEIQDFILDIEKAVGGKNWQQESEFWTKLAVNIYNQIQADLNQDPTHGNVSFAQMVIIIENAFQAYKEHKAEEENQDQ